MCASGFPPVCKTWRAAGLDALLLPEQKRRVVMNPSTRSPVGSAVAAAAVACVAAAVLSACAVQEPSPNVPSYQGPAPVYQPPTGTGPNPPSGTVVAPRYANTGVVSSIELIRGQSSSGMSPAGTIIGAVVGGVLGNQIGEGRGRTAATVAGAAGGALAGNAIGQRTQQTPDMYRVGIQYDNGGGQYIDVPNPGDLRTGDRVRVDGNQISRY
jgi:outer membrane lipoprotein SlyB